MIPDRSNAPVFVGEDVRLGAITPEEWDRTIQRAGASFILAHKRLTLWRRAQVLKGSKVRILRLLADGAIAGICIVRSRNGINTVRERLHLFPEYDVHWAQALQAVLRHVGTGFYRYGPADSISPPRSAELLQLAGVQITDVKPYTVHAVDFGRYAGWEDYERGLKPGIRNECRRAESRHGLHLASHSGRAIWPQIGGFARDLHRQPHRKGGRRAELRQVISIALSTATLRGEATMFAAVSDGRALARQYYVDFGKDRYYTAGAAARLQPSPAWWLTIRALREAYKRNPGGRVILGSFYPHLHDGSGDGLLDFRRRCGATSFDSDMFEFRYEAEAAQGISSDESP
ncbi:hypothetical protein [Novosphingobium olei]|uniref:hypothetical protein n=1 Tax=Novosphingobium olei TaxID=2728851 RepID=UPI003093410F|nr:hypothetical protein NSDW_19460 [Novosphingobium olei]